MCTFWYASCPRGPSSVSSINSKPKRDIWDEDISPLNRGIYLFGGSCRVLGHAEEKRRTQTQRGFYDFFPGMIRERPSKKKRVISPDMESDGFQIAPISSHMESDSFQIAPILRSIGLIAQKKASGSCRGVPAANPLFTWLKQESKTVSRHDPRLGMTPLMAHAG